MAFFISASTDYFLRCAFHFRSSHKQDDDRSVYEMLLTAQIFTTDEITTKFELTQNGITIQATLDNCALHIEEDQTKLNIYVPESSRDRELCYRRLLPSRLLANLMRGESAINTTHLDPRAVGIVADIMTCSDLIIENILEDAGIMRVSFPAEYVSSTALETASSMPEPRRYASGSDVPERSLAQSGPRTPEDNETAAKSVRYSSMPSPSSHTTRELLRAQFHEPSISLAASPRSNQLSVTNLLDVKSSTPDYRRLLDDLINAAKRRQGGFPSKGGVFGVQDLTSALPVDPYEDQRYYDCPFGVRSEHKLAYSMRIGAAGELYVSLYL
jgi:hypothetical protein